MTFVSEIETTIRMLREAVDGDVCSRSRVMDGLLDLRLEAGSLDHVVEVVDRALADLPGQTMVPADWWREQLDRLELVALDPAEPVA